ncbi:MAG: T9SS type A sorting domain-containing protein [Prevotellaceae bacterium]|jgi:hypothetical protein|nr:T9SS type A sorting domain-containing protein [Prevotellaceae bacterium]
MNRLSTLFFAIIFANAVFGQITSSRGDSFCEGNATTLTLTGGSGNNYVWTVTYGSLSSTADTVQNQNGGASITVTPHYFGTVYYRVYLNGSTTPLATKVLTIKDCCITGATADFTILKVCTPLNVDGNDTELEWGVSSWVNVDKVSFGSAIKNPAGKWRMLYDDQFIYLYVVVYDDIQPINSYWTAVDDNEGNGYNGDGVEIYLDAGTGFCVNGGNSLPLQIGLTYPTIGTTPGSYKNQDCNATFTNYSATIKPWNSVTKEWAMEVKFPAVLNGVNLNGDNINVEIGITQSNDGINRGSLMHTWTAKPDMYNSLSSLHTVPLADCASTRASKEVICENQQTELSTSIKSATAGVDENTAYDWQICYTGCNDNNVTSPNWTDVVSNIGNNVTITPDFSSSTSIYYRAVYNGEIAACPIAITLSSDIIVPTRYATICQGKTYTFYTQNLTETGSYIERVTSTNGCDSIIKLELAVQPKITETRKVEICLGETYSFYGQNLTSSGSYTADVPATAGCDSVITLNLTVLSIENDENGDCCIPNLIEQHWNDVIAVLNDRYNGGHKFTAFQWYKNGTIMPDQIKSYLYLPTTGLDTTAYYGVLLTTDNGTQMSSCTMRPIIIPDVYDYPQIIQGASLIRLKSPQSGTLNIFSVTGTLVGSQKIAADTNDITIPLKTGMYILQIIMADGTKESLKLIINHNL